MVVIAGSVFVAKPALVPDRFLVGDGLLKGDNLSIFIRRQGLGDHRARVGPAEAPYAVRPAAPMTQFEARLCVQAAKAPETQAAVFGGHAKGASRGAAGERGRSAETPLGRLGLSSAGSVGALVGQVIHVRAIQSARLYRVLPAGAEPPVPLGRGAPPFVLSFALARPGGGGRRIHGAFCACWWWCGLVFFR